MKSATEQLIELAERLNPTGEIGDGMVARFHALAAQARLEQGAVGVTTEQPFTVEGARIFWRGVPYASAECEAYARAIARRANAAL